MKAVLVKRFGSLFWAAMMMVTVGCAAVQPQKTATAPAPSASQEGVTPNSVDAAALEKLRRMDPAQVEELDRRMAEALTFYYDRKFGQALPLFQQVADRVETMDIMFWVGTSAMESGQMDLARANFEKMLAADPNLHRARLELAAVHFKTGRYEEARRELERVKAASPPPPPAVQQNIDRLLGAIEEQTQKVHWSASASQGYMWDTNASAGPELKQFNIAGGTFTPSATTARLKDEAAVTVLSGGLTYDMGAKNGWMWNTALFAYNQAYMDHSQFNYAIVDLSAGPWWVGRKDIVKLPVGFSHADYASDRLFWAFHFDPSYEHYFNSYISLKGRWSYRHEDYYRQSNLDNKSNVLEITPTLYLDNRRHMISAAAAWEDHDAYADRFAYDGPIYGLSYQWRIASQTELFFNYKWNRREYEGRAIINADRIDERNSLTAAVSQGFGKYFFASFAYNYLDNDSTIDVFEFERKTYTLNAGCRF